MSTFLPEAANSSNPEDAVERVRAMSDDELTDIWWAMATTDAPVDLLRMVTAELYSRDLAPPQVGEAHNTR